MGEGVSQHSRERKLLHIQTCQRCTLTALFTHREQNKRNRKHLEKLFLVLFPSTKIFRLVKTRPKISDP
jgi:hypothetical protein